MLKSLAQYLHSKLQKHIENRPPDFTVGEDYLRRWWLIPRNKLFNIYYHNFKVSDDSRAHHDHEYISLSFILDGEYVEHLGDKQYTRSAGDIKARLPKTLHRIEIPEDVHDVWTLFITGPRVRKWGFQVGPIVKNWLGFKTKSGWIDFEEYHRIYGEQLNGAKEKES